MMKYCIKSYLIRDKFLINRLFKEFKLHTIYQVISKCLLFIMKTIFIVFFSTYRKHVVFKLATLKLINELIETLQL